VHFYDELYIVILFDIQNNRFHWPTGISSMGVFIGYRSMQLSGHVSLDKNPQNYILVFKSTTQRATKVKIGMDIKQNIFF
jgi:hypothetical protein